jgi:hypothetical protein
MYNAVLLTEENRQLRPENARQKNKKAQRRTYIATGGILTGQEGIRRSQIGGEIVNNSIIEQQRELPQRAPNRCIMCKSLDYTACTC